MRIRWRDFELPTKLITDKETYTDTYGKFFVEPFERGFGSTIGHSLKRVLLSSIEGSAITSVRIEGIKHEYGIVPGVVEDVTDIILNLKNVFVKLHSDKPRMIKIEATKKGEVKARDIITDESVEIINEDLHIVTLSEDTRFFAEMEVRSGRGYKTAEEVAVSNREIDVIPMDAIFSPIRRAKVSTEETRVGRKTNYDRLIIEIWTNGSIQPEMALIESSKILRKHLNPFIHYFELGRELPQTDEQLIEETVVPEEEKAANGGDDQNLSISVSELDLSVRAANCLKMANIKTIGEIVGKREDELLELKNFGKTTLDEIKKKLTQMGLSFKIIEDANIVGKEMSYEA